MSARTDLDGKLRAWLDLMPDEAPDHAIATVLHAIDATAQPRPSRGWPSWRTPMNRSLAALAAAVVIVVVGAALLLRPGTTSHVATVPSASVSPTGSAASASPSAAASAAAVVPDALQHGWYGGLRAMGGDSSPTGVHLVIGPSTFVLSAANRQDYPFMHGDMSLAPDGRLTVSTTGPTDCLGEAAGTYTWTLSPSGRMLTISAVADSCQRTAGALAGTWWPHGCPDNSCYGPIDAGTYGSQYIDPRMHSGADWTPRYGAVTFTVPDGWAAAGDSPGSFRLEPAATYALEASGASEAGHFEIDVYAQPALPKDAASCDGRIDPNAGHSVDALVAGLRANPALSVTEQPATSIGGHPARVMDLALKPSWRHACPDLGRSSSYLVGTEAFDPGKVYPYVLALADQERHRLLLVDIGGRNSAAVVIDSSDPTRFDELLNAATPIVQSFQFP